MTATVTATVTASKDKTIKHDDLVSQVHDYRQYDDADDVSPRFLDQLGAPAAVSEQRPKIRRP